MELLPHTITICSTARLVRGIALRDRQHQELQGVAQWQASEAYTLQEWLHNLILHATLLGELSSDALPSLTLSPVAEAFLWEQAISACLATHEAAALFDIRALAKSAMEANQLLWDWQIAESEMQQFFIGQETRQFLRWRPSFQQLCSQKNAVEASRLMDMQIALIEQQVFNFPGQIVLTGFDRITPLEQRLFSHLQGCGVVLEKSTFGSHIPTQVTTYALSDSHAECRAAVAWAQQQLAANPHAQLAIISPALGNVRRELSDLLDDTFHTDSIQPGCFERPRCYDFSLGLALSEYPIVHSALQLLKLATSRANLSFESVTPVLQDVYWGDHSELDARAQLDAYVRQHLSSTYRLDSLYKQASKLDADGIKLGTFIRHLGFIVQFQQAEMQWQLPSVWVSALVALLDQLNWSKSRNQDNRGLSSHEYQTQQAFFKNLNALSALDGLLGKISASGALQKITELCNTAIFQPEATGETHIQILGLLETPAMQLDAVWAMNMNDQHWPAPVRLNPLLPADLQRSHGTPNASAGMQTEFATLVQKRLLLSTPHFIFSYALKEDDRELRASPLLAPWPPATQTPEGIIALSERMALPATMQMVDDSVAPPILVDETVRGGVKLFATQAICPAWAFYQYRLGAKKLETPVDGLDSMARGSLLHQVLQFFWQDCQTLTQLKATSAEQRLTAIEQAIEKSIQAMKHQLGVSLPAQLLELERQRLIQIVQFWLDLELGRADFTVKACEQKHTLVIEGLTLNLSIDRIDTLADGGLVVIDYKTSSMVTTKSWSDDRIAEPQLPIYASLALHGERVAAVCFGKVRSDETKFIGLSADDGVLPDVKAFEALRANSAFARFKDWDGLLQHWQLSLKVIAQEIKSGEASVTFKQIGDLDYCEVKPLLRLPERRMQFERLQAQLAPD
jgi:exodeoxyribonuclease-5